MTRDQSRRRANTLRSPLGDLEPLSITHTYSLRIELVRDTRVWVAPVGFELRDRLRPYTLRPLAPVRIRAVRCSVGSDAEPVAPIETAALDTVSPVAS